MKIMFEEIPISPLGNIQLPVGECITAGGRIRVHKSESISRDFPVIIYLHLLADIFSFQEMLPGGRYSLPKRERKSIL